MYGSFTRVFNNFRFFGVDFNEKSVCNCFINSSSNHFRFDWWVWARKWENLCLEGIKGVAPTGIMLGFAILFFGDYEQCGIIRL